MTESIAFKTGYLDDALDDLPGVVERATEHLAGVEFDTLVGTGMSGALVVPSIAMAMGKDFVLVRKANDGSHHNGRMIGNLGARWVFVDDFVQSGATRWRVVAAIARETEYYGHAVVHVGDYCYAEYDYGTLPDARGRFRPTIEQSHGAEMDLYGVFA